MYRIAKVSIQRYIMIRYRALAVEKSRDSDGVCRLGITPGNIDMIIS